jgi:hypothetical protein
MRCWKNRVHGSDRVGLVPRPREGSAPRFPTDGVKHSRLFVACRAIAKRRWIRSRFHFCAFCAFLRLFLIPVAQVRSVSIGLLAGTRNHVSHLWECARFESLQVRQEFFSNFAAQIE